jgi:hypothetical protein
VTYGEIPFQKRWDVLMPIITQLYVDEDKTVAEVAAAMKLQHGFDAG